MRIKNILTPLLTILAAILLYSCTMTSTNRNNASVSVPYSVAKGYFVKNTFSRDSIECTIIRDQIMLDSLLGMGATMGKNGMPTRIDFGRQFAIACIHPETDSKVQLEAKELKMTDDRLTLRLSVIRGEKQSYTIVPLQLLVVEGNPPTFLECELEKR
jgi:hypothetical protein